MLPAKSRPSRLDASYNGCPVIVNARLGKKKRKQTMIKRFFFQSAVAVLLFTCLAGAASNQHDQRVGGPCHYKSYPGQATILPITGIPEGNAGQVDRFEVKFSFLPQEAIQENFARVNGKIFNLDGNNFQSPDSDFLTAHRLHVGRVLEGNLQVIISGT